MSSMPCQGVLSFRPAELADVDTIVTLVNSAYRGDSSRQGWTTEADLLDGQRTDADEIRSLILDKNSLILLGWCQGQLISSVHLQNTQERAAYLGMLTVRPGLQGAGLGRRVMEAAEDFARRTWGARRMRMTVIDRRHELIAYYERRGYRRTGESIPFPDDPRFGLPKVAGLRLEVLEKRIAESD